MLKNSRAYGNLGEDFASSFIRKRGYKIIDRNFRCKLGEIDIVALHNQTLCVIEVKTRSSTKYGSAVEAVGTRKLAKLKLLTSYYLQTHRNLPKKARIEVVAIQLENGRLSSCKLIKADL